MKNMSSIQEIKKNLENKWIQFLNSNATKLTVKNLYGASPPSVFVGHHGYPKIKIGPMIPPLHGNTSILDSPEKWLGKTIDEIANYRLSLVRGVYKANIQEVFGRHIELLQELAMANKPAESEVQFDKIPIVDIEQKKNLGFDIDSVTYGFVASLNAFKISSSLSVDKRLEDAFYDKDLHAKEAIVNLYQKDVEISKINRIFSMGMLGLHKNRKLVPTKWSISAIDDIISTNLTKEIENYSPIELFEVYQHYHLGNYYSIILIPYNSWIFEMQEGWIDNNGNIAMGIDYENEVKLNHHPSIAGAFFAARVSVSEHLNKIKRKAAVLILREIHPEYLMPVGVWQVREGLREALKSPITKFESFEKALSFASTFMSISNKEWIKNSKIYNNVIKQNRISDFFS
jgi:DNA repair protein NreA